MESVRALVEPTAQALGCEVLDVEVLGSESHPTLRITLDREAGVSPRELRRDEPACEPPPRRRRGHRWLVSARGLVARTQQAAQAPRRFRAIP
ncbi:MAG: hypothetical protein IPK07_06200 [Deltaproteobacteria bacterium]|nr:hypothetical protein [Deltaproteobacteria bacterium]